jgi:hypothetical protein
MTLTAPIGSFTFGVILHFSFVKESATAYCFAKNKRMPASNFRLRRNGRSATYQQLTGGTAGVSEILAQIDREVAQLQQARVLLGGKAAPAPKKAAAAPVARKKARKKRNLTPEGRRRIAEAIKRRWAGLKKAAAAK